MLLLQVIVGGLLLGAVYALFSSGLTLIWGMMNFINFAHGEFVMLGMYVALLVVTWIGGGPAVFGFVAAGAARALGVGIYFALIRHVIRGPMLAQILSTFGLALLLRYTAFWILRRISCRCRRTRSAAQSNRRHPAAGRAARRRRRRDRADGRAASAADAHLCRQPAARGRRRPQRGDADGHPARPHAGAGLGPCRRRAPASPAR